MGGRGRLCGKEHILELQSEPCWMVCTRQVSAFGDDQTSDHLDSWEVSFSGGQWMRDDKVGALSAAATMMMCLSEAPGSNVEVM